MKKEKETMTIHRALSELKLIDSKIDKAIKSIIPIGVYQKGKKINAHISEEDFKKNAQSNYDSFNSLVERKVKIKNAIVTANATTKLRIGEKELTISEAINYKTVIGMKKEFLEVLKARNNHAIGSLNKSNETVNANLQLILEKTFGANKPEKETMEHVSKPFLEQNEFKLFDPLKLDEKITKLESEIATFESEVDSALSEINAVTKIEI